MNNREQEKEAIIKGCCQGDFTVKDAAQRLKISERQVKRLKAKHKKGVSFLHGNCGKIPAKAIDPILKQKIISIFNLPQFKKVNFLHFNEILLEDYHINISYTAMRNLLIDNHYKSPKAKRCKKKIHKVRQKRKKFGELLQTDGTQFDWFNSGKTYVLHAFIDDATGMITAFHMSKNECMDGYFEILRQTLVSLGTPEAIYADGSSIFFVNKHNKEKLSIQEQLVGMSQNTTQYGKILDELGISLIHAHSSQAKGKVERLWETLQSRLPVEFAKRNITDIDAANDFLKNDYLKVFNDKFSQNSDAVSCFVPLPKTIDLDELLSVKKIRKIDRGGCFSLDGIIFQVIGDVINTSATIHISKRLGIMVKHKNLFFEVIPIKFENKLVDDTDSVKMIINKFVQFYCLKNEHLA